MNPIELVLLGVLILICTLHYVSKKRQALNTLLRLGDHFIHEHGCSSALEDFDKCMTLVRFYGILPQDFGYQNIETLHKMAKVSLLRSITRADESHSAILKEYNVAVNSGNKEDISFFGNALETSKKNLDLLQADLEDLETRMPRPQPALLTSN
jgi:hypothetical protein